MKNYLLNAGLLAGATALTQAPAAAGQDKPNVVVFLADDLGWSDLGCYGSTYHETPNLDRLSAEGMRFTNGYATCPVCSPSRASIMSGKYPARLDTTDFFGAAQPDTVMKKAKSRTRFAHHKKLPAG